MDDVAVREGPAPPVSARLRHTLTEVPAIAEAPEGMLPAGGGTDDEDAQAAEPFRKSTSATLM